MPSLLAPSSPIVTIEQASCLDPLPQFIVRTPETLDEGVQVTLDTLYNLAPNTKSNIDIKIMKPGAKYEFGEFFHVLRVNKAGENTANPLYDNTFVVRRKADPTNVTPIAMKFDRFEAPLVEMVIEEAEEEENFDSVELEESS